MQVVVDKKKKEFGVYEVVCTSPGAPTQLIGKKYHENGSTLKGIFNIRTQKLESATEVDFSLDEGFLGMGTGLNPNQKYGVQQGSDGLYCGELNALGQKDGRGILIDNDSNIFISNWKDGLMTVGKCIEIYPGKEFKVGEKFIPSKLKVKPKTILFKGHVYTIADPAKK